MLALLLGGSGWKSCSHLFTKMLTIFTVLDDFQNINLKAKKILQQFPNFSVVDDSIHSNSTSESGKQLFTVSSGNDLNSANILTQNPCVSSHTWLYRQHSAGSKGSSLECGTMDANLMKSSHSVAVK